MKSKRVKKYMIVVFCLTLSVLSACSSSKSSDSSASPSASANSTAAPLETVKADSTPAPAETAAIDPLGKISPPITITAVRRTVQGQKYADGQSMDNNSWINYYKDLGINVKYTWSVDATQFENKMNVAIGTSDLPDLMPQITGTQASKLIKGDQLLDMKPYLDQYLSPLAKQILYSDDGAIMNATLTSDGKQYLLPVTAADMRADIKSLWIRKDWLDKLKLQAPKTTQDFENIAKAFTESDPDGDGKADTYGFGIAGKNNLILDWGGTDGVFEMFHTQPGPWWDESLFYEKDSSGQIIWSGSKPGVKQALSLLQDMYKKGYLAKDFGTADLPQDFAAGKVGMYIGRWWQAGWPLPDLKKKDPKADWIVVGMPSSDGQPTQPFGYRPGNVYAAVSKNSKNPEAIVKMINGYVEKVYGPNADFQHFNNSDITNNMGDTALAAPFQVNDPFQQAKDYAAVSAAVKSKDPSKLNPTQKPHYDEIQKYLQDPTYVVGWTDWMNYSGADGTPGKYHFEDVKESDVLKNAFFGVPDDLMVSKVPAYKKMAEEIITKIIYNQAPVDDWDKTVNSWNQLGGTEILQDVQKSVK